MTKTAGSGGTSFLYSTDGTALLSGTGSYIADVRLPGMLEAAFVRSPVARARLRDVNLTAASGSPGVLCAADGARVHESLGAVLPWASKVLHPSDEAPEHFHLPAYPLLPLDALRYDGEPVAIVAAENRYLAEDAAAQVRLDLEEQTPVLDPEFALSPECDQIFDDVEGNVALANRYGSKEDAGSLFDDAALVLRRRYRMHRSGNPPLETTGTVASYENGNLMVWSTIQRPHMLRVALADILGLPAARVRVIAPQNIGGGFGWKSPMYRETAVVAWLAMQLERPVRYIEDRTEALRKGIHERDQIWDMVAAFDSDGRILGLEADVIADVGTVLVDMYGLLPSRISATLPFPYDIKWVRTHLRCAITNKAPMGVNRPAGRMPAVWAIERLMDDAGRRLGVPSEEIRLKNYVRSFPYASPLGQSLTDSDYVGTTEDLLRIFRFDERRREVADLRKAGRRVGIGLAACVEICRPLTSFGGAVFYNQPQYASVTLRMAPDGSVEVLSGDAPQGQARHTTMAKVAAQELGVELDMVSVTTGDTRMSPLTNSNTDVASVVGRAARALRRKVIRVAAHLMGVDQIEDDFLVAAGTVSHVPDGSTLSVRQIAWTALMRPFELPEGSMPDLSETAYVEAPYSPTSFAAHAAVVEVDPELGKLEVLAYGFVGDSGKPLNPRGLETAVHGGIVTGIANTVCEAYSYNNDGRMTSSTMREYGMATAGETPAEVVIGHRDTATPATLYGHKRSISEGVPAGVPPAIANAIIDAFEGAVDLTTVPLHPDELWRNCAMPSVERTAS